MKVHRLIGWGIASYAIINLAWSGVVLYGFGGTIAGSTVMLLALVAVLAIATRSLGYRTERDVLPYALGWMLIAVVLDAVFVVPTTGWEIFTDWNAWVGYMLVFCVPLIVTLVQRKKAQLRA